MVQSTGVSAIPAPLSGPIPLSEFGAGILLSGEGVLAYDFLVAIIPLKIIFNNKGMV